MAENSGITDLLAQFQLGDREAESRLVSLVYGELRRLAEGDSGTAGTTRAEIQQKIDRARKAKAPEGTDGTLNH
jgi:ECF sigma factor